MEPEDLLGVASAPLWQVPISALELTDVREAHNTAIHAVYDNPQPALEPPLELLTRLDEDQLEGSSTSGKLVAACAGNILRCPFRGLVTGSYHGNEKQFPRIHKRILHVCYGFRPVPFSRFRVCLPEGSAHSRDSAFRRRLQRQVKLIDAMIVDENLMAGLNEISTSP